MSGFSLLEFIQQVINGLTLGSIYALIAIGYTMVYGIIGMINFAHGEIYMIGAYVGLLVITALGLSGVHSIPAILLATLAISILITGSYGWTVERLAYRPLRGSPRLVPLISAIGVSIFLQNYVQLGQGARDVSMQPVLTGGWRFGPADGFQVYLSYMQVLIAVVTVAFMTGLTLFIGRSRMGRACRACSEDRAMANLLGIDTDRVIAVTFVLGAALAAVAGVLVGMYYGLVNPFIGFLAGLKAFTAAVLGGIGSIPGAMLGGIVLGLAESFASAYLQTEYKDVVAFGLLILVLLVRPTGLLGRPDVEKVYAMRRTLSDAFLAAVLTAVLLVPIFGLRIHVDGVNVSLNRTPMPVIVAVVAVFLLRLLRQPLQQAWAWLRVPDSWRENVLTAALRQVKQQPRYQWALWILLLAVAVLWPFTASRGAVDVMTLALIYVMLGLGLNIVVGFAGLLVLGYAAFYAVGAYTYALLAQHFGLSFWLGLPVAGALAALTGFLLGLPVLQRLRGDYLAIVTLGFGEITRLLLNNLNVLTGGPDGIGNIPRPTLFGLEFSPRPSKGGATFHEFFGLDYSGDYGVIFMYLLGLALVLLILFVINRLLRMPLGRAWEALREDEIACRSLGLSPTTIKLSALTLSAAFAGLAGAFFAARQGYINPESFTFIESAMVLAIVVLGGMGSQLGVMLAAIAITALPELAREFNEYRMLAFGLVMVLMMIWRPQGLIPAVRPRLELPEHAGAAR